MILLYLQSLADRIGVSCSLVRGNYNRAWNEVMLTDEDDSVSITLMFSGSTVTPLNQDTDEGEYLIKGTACQTPMKLKLMLVYVMYPLIKGSTP